MQIFNKISLQHLRGDLFGGLTAAVVALPLGLAFGVASGIGPEAGLYSAALVGLFAAVFGGTPAQISGPTGPMTVVMTGIVIEHMARDPENGLANAFGIVVLAGLFQVLFGVLRLGRYVIQVSYPVISGFMSGIGVIIILIQLHPLAGLDPVVSPLQALRDLSALIDQYHLPTVLLGILCVVLAFSWRGRINDFLPVPLLLLVGGSLAVFVVPQFGTVSTLGAIESSVPVFQPPSLDPSLLFSEIGAALLIATLGSIDSLLTSLVADNITRTHHDSDKELIGQGIGNMVAGCFAALPGAGATVRTVVNVKSGGRTALSGIFHALIILVVVIGAGFLTAHVPQVVLAAILIKVGVDIVDVRFIRRIPNMPLFSAGLMLLVLGLTVFVDLITAVFVGVFLANMVTVERLTGIQLDNISIYPSDHASLAGYREKYGDIVRLELNGPMSFGVARGINRRLAEAGEFQTLMIDLANAHLLGVSTALVVLDLVEDAQAQGKRVLINRDLDKPVFRNLRRLGVFDRISDEDRF